MPTIPLYNTAAEPDGWHQVRSPGGYEVWAFHGVQNSSRQRIFAALFDGDPFDSRYRRLYRQYMRRPTQCKPPLPCQFQRACIAINDLLRIVQFPAGSLLGSTQLLDVRLGSNHISRQAGTVEMLIAAEVVACEISFDLASSKANVS